MDWIAGWNKRIKLTISGSYIEGDLSNFPILVHLDSTCSGVFNELGSNSKRISVVASDQSQCYVEVESWDESTNNAWLWVKVSTLSSGVDSDLYLYYDNLRPDNSSYVGTVGETSAQSVWDENFVGVWHMNQDPTGGNNCIKDSTSNTNHGTPTGMVSNDLVDGKIGKSLDFDGNNDIIIVSDSNSLDLGSTGTLEVLVYINSFTNSSYPFILAKTSTTGYTDQYRPYAINLYHSAGSGNDYCYGNLGDGTSHQNKSVQTYTAQWDHFVSWWDGTNFKTYLDGSQLGSTSTQTVTPFNGNGVLCIACERPTSYSYPYQGLICEIRISNIARSAPWIKATYNSNWNQLLNYGNEEIVSSGFLPGWNNRLKLTIQSDYIDNTLTDFPVMIKLSNSSGFNSYDNRSVFYELEANINRKKIAITDSTGVLQCFVEIERFSCEETEAVLWTRLPIIYDSIGTRFYLYYDKTQADNNLFVGDVNSIVAQNVWDDNFVGVWHMNQAPVGADSIKDSTSNTNHGTASGVMTSGDLVDGKVGKALDFDETDDYLYTVSANDILNITTALTLEAIIIPSYTLNSSISAVKGICCRQHIPTVQQDSYGFQINLDGKLLLGSCGGNIQGTKVSWAADTPFNVVGTYNSSGLTGDLFVDSVKEVLTVDNFDAMAGATNSFVVAAAEATQFFPGIIDEVRVSNTVRSDSWIKATYHSNWDSLIVFEKESITASWLDDWAKRIKLTIDQTKIDSSLTDFPVLVTLSSGVQSDFFNELDYGSVEGDAFSSFEPGIKWALPDPDIPNFFNYDTVNKRLHFARNEASAAYYNIRSKFVLKDDYDIQIDFGIDVLNGTVFNSPARLYVYNLTGSFSAHIQRYKASGTDGYYANITGSAAWNTAAHSAGKLRITRINSTLRIYYWTGSAWYERLSKSNIDLGLHVLEFGAYQKDSQAIDSWLDNFVINTGTVIWPEGTYPNRKKIVLTKNNGTTQCPVEIEQWDFYNGKVNLWTKIPTVVFDNDTDIYLYYDSSKNDNDSYVGDVGSTPGKAVWDSNFVGVWHMNQDPSGGASCMKDSTGINNGTPGGSMTPGDLVDGKIGKSLDFDGSDDKITLTTSDGLFALESITVEGIVKCTGIPSSYPGYYAPLYSTRDSGATKGFSFWLDNTSSNKKITIRNRDSEGGNVATANGVWSDDETFNLVMTHVANTSQEIWKNGVSLKSDTKNWDFQKGATTPEVGQEPGHTDYSWKGLLEETRISNIARSASWIKATYYSNWNTLLTYDSFQNYTPPPDYYYHGYVKEKGVYVSRKVYLYKRDTGLLMDSGMSNAGTGYYLLETSVSGEHFILALDDDAGDDYNALVQDRIYPNGM
jgi:hypothetical protein